MATETATATAAATEMSLKEQIDAVMQSIEKLDETIAHAMKERKAATAQLSKLVHKLSKERQPRKAKRDPSQPKGETPAQVAAWNQAVNQAHEKMKSEGWAAFTTRKGQAFAAGEKRDGAWVFSDTGRAPTYKDAMSYAAHMKGGSTSGTDRSASPVKRAATPAKAAAAPAPAPAAAAGGAGRAASPKPKAAAAAPADAKAKKAGK
jgi:regulator of replication initiation timing